MCDNLSDIFCLLYHLMKSEKESIDYGHGYGCNDENDGSEKSV